MADSFFIKSLRIFSVVASYWFVSISLVFINKYLLSSTNVKLEAPLFITWFQCVVGVILCFILSKLSKLYPNLISFPEFKINIETQKKILPLSAVFVMMIACNNLCLKHVGVAFYFIVRSLATVFNVFLSYLLLGQTTSFKAILCCGIIVTGFCMGVAKENVLVGLSVLGVVFGVGSSIFLPLNAIYTKKVLPFIDQNIWTLSMYNNMNACVLFVPLILLNSEVMEVWNFPKILDPYFWLFMVVSGIFGFSIGYVCGLQIQITSPLTHNISGTAKAAVQTVLATVFYREHKDLVWWASNCIILFGSAAYTQVRRMEMKVKFESDKKGAEEELVVKDSDDSTSDEINNEQLIPPEAKV